MPLRAGSRLGPHEIVSFIGAGGMGEVYEARDTRLDRRVAIKVLPSDLANDPEFRARFAREGRAIAALNHPHICGLHDIGRENETDYLVLELLEGETLAARLARGALPMNQVLRFGAEIANALEAAHRHGIVHRDLKPGNVMLTPAGTKLLDFGLAKNSVSLAGHSLSALATASGTATAEGTIVGTLQYMAPEQVQGHPADARTDLFALGAVLYEMATGRKAFAGSTRASVLAKILETDPPALSATLPTTPIVFEHLVQVCLAKDPGERWQTARDVALQLQWLQQQQSAPGAVPARARARASWREWLAWSAAVIGLATATWVLVRPTPRLDRAGTPTRTEMLLPPRVWLNEWFDFPAISPDGRTVVFAGAADGVRRLYVRPINGGAFQPIAGTEGAYGPFWLGDGRAVGFFAGESVRRVEVAGGGVVTIGTYESNDFLGGRRGTGNQQGAVLFADGGIIWRAGERVASRVRPAPGPPGSEDAHEPQFLADGQRFLYFSGGKDRGVYLASLASAGRTRVADTPAPAHYAAGHLLYAQQRTLMARPFDPDRIQSSANDFPVADGLVESHFSAAQNGTIVYRPAESELATLAWFTRSGARIGTLGEVAEYRQVALSPSGRRLVVARGNPNDMDLWVADAASGVFARTTRLAGSESDPVWSPDERSIAYSYLPFGGPAATEPEGVRRLDLATGADGSLPHSPCQFVDDWTSDGRVICRESDRLMAVPVSGAGAAVALEQAPLGDQWKVSPDGRWVAYNSPASGEWEVYVAPLEHLATAHRVSVAGGVQPLWRQDGKELFYLTLEGTVMSVPIKTSPALVAGSPQALFKTNLIPADGWQQYSVTPDGQRFLVKEPVRQFFTVLQNWLPGGRH